MKSIVKNNPLSEQSHPLDREIDRTKGREAIVKVASAFVLLVLVLFVALYFTLPAFQVRRIRYSGLHYLEPEEVETLADADGGKSLLFVGEGSIDTMSKAIYYGSSGLVLSVNFHGNMFGMSCEIEETYPMFRLGEPGKETSYLSSGREWTLFAKDFADSRLGSANSGRILSAMEKDFAKTPFFRFPSSFDSDAFFRDYRNGFSTLPFHDRDLFADVLEDVVFQSEGKGLSSLDVSFSYHEEKYLIEGIPYSGTDGFFTGECFHVLFPLLEQNKGQTSPAQNGLEGEYYRFAFQGGKDGSYSLSPIGGEGNSFQVQA